MEVQDVKLEPDDYDSLGEDATSSMNVEHDLEHLIALPGKYGKIRRPPNAFMLFARDHRRSISVTNPYVPNKQISSILGNQWRNLNPDQKRGYYDKAKALDSAHKQQYPNYVYNPKEARERKKSRQLLKRSRKLQGLSKFGKERQYHCKSSMGESSYFEDSKNSSYSNDKKETEIPYNELKSIPSRTISPVYVTPNVCPKYPLASAMDDPPTDELGDTRRHMMTFLSDHSSNGKNASPAMQNSNRSANAMPASSTITCDNNGFEPCNFRTSSPLTSTESLALKSQTNSDNSLPFAVTESFNSAKASKGCEFKPQIQLDKTPECQHDCKCSENQRASASTGIRMHCACSISGFPVFEGICHPPTPPIPHHYYNRSYMSPYMANPYNIHPIYPLPYLPLNQASSEIPAMHPSVYHTSPPPINMYHPSGALYGPRYHLYMNGDPMQRDDYASQRLPSTPCRIADFHNRGRHPSHAARRAESPIAEDDEDKDSETDRPPSNSSLNNSSSNLVIVTDNFDNN